MTQWCLSRLEIEGFRGINNEGDPFCLEFDCNKITSISSHNAVGKSSIYEAVCFAIRGYVPKLRALHADEKASLYYLNRFFGGDEATIRLTVSDVVGGVQHIVEVRRHKNGSRSVTSQDHPNPEQLLRELDREFILLDYRTLHSFVQDSPLERGRSFSKLLGLADYSEVRAKLRGLSNTQAFNNFFGVHLLTAKIESSKRASSERRVAAYKAAATLCNLDLAELVSDKVTADLVLSALKKIPSLSGVITADALDAVDFEACFAAVSEAEGGEDRKKYVALSQSLAEAKKLSVGSITPTGLASLETLAEGYANALAETAGAVRQQLLEQARTVLESDTWEDSSLCPTCEQKAPFSILEFVQGRLAQYEAADAAASALKAGWGAIDWTPVQRLEAELKGAEEPPLFATAVSEMTLRCVSAVTISKLAIWLQTLIDRHASKVELLDDEVSALGAKLPKSLVEVTKAIGEAKAIKENLSSAMAADDRTAALEADQKAIERIKKFLEDASTAFSGAEDAATKNRMQAVIPEVQKLFGSIMGTDVVPKLDKPVSGEELRLILEKFWTETDVEALPLLSESYKNALSISIFLSAALLYSGAPRFMILDDITSSFDGGSQYFTMETIRRELARPHLLSGLQFIILSHDPMLEKYFNKSVHDGDWDHKRIQGTPKTLLMISEGGGYTLRTKLIKLLDAGLIDNVDAGVRQYLEFKLFSVIQRMKIRVPVEFAINDHMKMVQNAIDAIDLEIKIHKSCGDLVLDASQESSFNANVASIIGNFLAHFATAHTGAIGEAALRATIASIDALDDCFSYVDASGQKRFYKSIFEKT